MNKKKVIIGVVIIGAVIIILVVAKSLLGSFLIQNGTTNYYGGLKELGNASLPSTSLTNPLSIERVQDAESPAASVRDTPATVLTGEDPVNPVDKKIIKSGDMTLKVSDADKAVSQITDIAKNNGGDIFSTNLHEGANNVKSGTVTIKVPVANFEKAFAEVKKIGSLVVRESTSGQDVTEQYTDLQSRLRNKQAEEQAFARILERSGDIDDVLKVTRELARVRGEIELLQGRIKLLESQTDMSTITAQISEDAQITITDKWRPFQVAKDALNNLFRDIQKFVNFAIVLVIRVIPVLIVYLAFLWIIYLVGRKIYRKIKERKGQVRQ